MYNPEKPIRNIWMALILSMACAGFLQASEQEPDSPEAHAMQVLDNFMLAFNAYDAHS